MMRASLGEALAMTLGAMQDWPLRIMRLLDYAQREHGEREIVSRWADGSETRTNWNGIARDSRRSASRHAASASLSLSAEFRS